MTLTKNEPEALFIWRNARLAQDMTDEERVAEEIKAAKRYISEHTVSPADRSPEEQAIIARTICIDFDDTLFVGLWQPDNPTHEIGPPIWANINKAKKLTEEGWHLVILTARGWEDEQAIAQACKEVGLDILRVECGKPIAVGYVDDRAVHESEDVWGQRKRWTPAE